VAVAVGDVMGKGIDAAVVMGEVRSALRAYALIDPSPSAVLAHLDALVSRDAVAEQLVTVAYGLVSPERDRVTVALAGHPSPLVVHGDEVNLLPEGTGSALGVGAGPWPQVEVAVEPGTTLVFYSDGLVERRDRELGAGIAALVEEVRNTPERRRHPRDLCARLAAALTSTATDDDVTLLAVSATAAQGALTAATRLPDDTRAPAVARRFLRGTLTGWELQDETIETAELCASELVTNAVIHTGTAAEVTARLDTGVLTVAVRDGGGEEVVRPESLDDPLVVSGRGLGLVEALSSAWGAERSADGTTVWFEIEDMPATA
jgi:anti-sigma regulatory factor (Ser/Thr protein kinase)